MLDHNPTHRLPKPGPARPATGAARRSAHGLRPRADQALRPERPALHLLSDRGGVRPGLRRRALCRGLPRDQRQRSAAVAVLPHPLLRHRLLLLRLQQDRHQGPQPGPALPGPGLQGDGDAVGAVRRRSRGRAAALGRRHADLHQPGADARADGADRKHFKLADDDTGEFSIEIDPREAAATPSRCCARSASTA
jgi:hypothetical protein